MAGAATARVGDVVSFTVTVTNRGTATATGVVLSVATAAGEPVVGHVDSDRVFHAPCALADTTLTCDVGVLGVSQTATASLRVGPLVRAGRRTTTARATAAGGQTPTAQAAFMTTVVAPSPAPSAHPTPTTAPPTVAPPTQPPAVRPPTVRPPGGRTTGQPTGTRVKGVKLVRGSDGVVRRLPATGRPTGQLAAFGLALLAAGATFRYAGRRRRS
jgi:LPXTG-motif cell wall-anchored protein